MGIGIEILPYAHVADVLPVVQKPGLKGADGLTFIVILGAAGYRPAEARFGHDGRTIFIYRKHSIVGSLQGFTVCLTGAAWSTRPKPSLNTTCWRICCSAASS